MINFNSADGLEVNASEVHASLKVSSYIDNKTDEVSLMTKLHRNSKLIRFVANIYRVEI